MYDRPRLCLLTPPVHRCFHHFDQRAAYAPPRESSFHCVYVSRGCCVSVFCFCECECVCGFSLCALCDQACKNVSGCVFCRERAYCSCVFVCVCASVDVVRPFVCLLLWVSFRFIAFCILFHTGFVPFPVRGVIGSLHIRIGD